MVGGSYGLWPDGMKLTLMVMILVPSVTFINPEERASVVEGSCDLWSQVAGLVVCEQQHRPPEARSTCSSDHASSS